MSHSQKEAPQFAELFHRNDLGLSSPIRNNPLATVAKVFLGETTIEEVTRVSV